MNTHAAVSTSSRTHLQTHNPLIKMWREFTSPKPMVATGHQAGVRPMRPLKDPIQKLLDKAGTLYWKWQELLEKDEDDQLDERQGNKKMGRPPVPLATLRQRAKYAYETQLAELREQELVYGREPVPEDEIIAIGERLRVKGPGRPAISEIGRKFRHLRRKLKTLEEAMSKIDHAADPVYDGIGRPAMSSRERVVYYEREIHEVKRDIEQAMNEMPPIERIKIMLDNARIDRRDAGMRLKKAEHDGADAEAIDTLKNLESVLAEEVQTLETQLQDEVAHQPAKFESPVKTVQIVPTQRTYSPMLQEIIAKLESQLIVPTPPTQLTKESLLEYKEQVALAKEFNESILEQIESLKAG